MSSANTGKLTSSSVHFLLSSHWLSPEAISSVEDGDAQLSVGPSGLFLWSHAAAYNNGIFWGGKANKEAANMVSNRGKKADFLGLPRHDRRA